VLDRKRLGNQRNEVLVLIRGGWPNHPASKMWQGYFYWLGCYGLAICREWKKRGYVDNVAPKLIEEMGKYRDTGAPWWLGDKLFHRAHQSNLVRKLPEHYRRFFPRVPDNLQYWWPQQRRERK